MASIHEPTSPGNIYSNLEAVYPAEPGHLSLHPGYRNGDEGTEGKETWHGVEEVGRDSQSATGFRGFMKRRYWERSMRSIVIAAAVVVVIIVVVVASVVATRKSKNKSPTPVPTPVPTSTQTSTPTSSILSSTATATSTIVPPVPVDRGRGLLFSPENWYTFNNNDGEVNYWAQSYADDTSAGSLRTLKEYSDAAPRATDMQFQIRPVPITWPNSTLDTGERTYWISCRSSGPTVRLTMLADEWERESSGISSNLHFHPQPKDHTNAAQYWYFEEVDGLIDGSWYKLYNMKAGHDYPAAFQSKWGNPLLWTPPHPASWEQWRVEARIRIVSSEEKFTWQIDPGPDVDPNV